MKKILYVVAPLSLTAMAGTISAFTINSTFKDGNLGQGNKEETNLNEIFKDLQNDKEFNKGFPNDALSISRALETKYKNDPEFKNFNWNMITITIELRGFRITPAKDKDGSTIYTGEIYILFNH